jgi:hypothetical protein
MLTHTKAGDELMTLAVTAEAHLRDKGHDVKIAPNESTTAFDILPAQGGEMLCRVQAVGAETWEVVRPGGDTLTGLGDQRAFLHMIERVVADAERKAA